ncbi:MAG: CoA transferase, partial [Actinomycetota bacterium]|nr:CoA transferase [Actinomycetota bacterium]
GVLDALGLGGEEMLRINPALVYVSISGFGPRSPYAHLAGVDLIAQGMSGVMTFTGDPKGEVVKIGVPLSDLNAGSFAATSAIAAYHHSHRTGEGQTVDVSLLDSVLAYTVWEADQWFSKGLVARPLGTAHRAAAPYQAFDTADSPITVGAGTDRLWERLTDALESPELATDPRFLTVDLRMLNREVLTNILSKIFLDRTREEWLQRLHWAGVPSGPIFTVEQIWTDEHVRKRDMIVTLDASAGDSQESRTYVGSPMKFSRTPVRIDRPAGWPGRDTREVLSDWGVPSEEVDELLVRSIVAE